MLTIFLGPLWLPSWEPREAVQCTSANAAIRGAGRIGRAEGNVGAVALSHTGDPVSGEFADSIVLKAFDECRMI